MIDRFLQPRLADRYILKLMMRPMLAAIAVTMAALLMERILRLFDLVTGTGASIGPILAMALVLSPHYLNLVLPAGFCIAVLSTLVKMSHDNELDALESAGWSLRRIGAVFVVAGCILSVFSVILFGVIQPYSRYAYRAIKHTVINAVWDGRVERGVFFDTGNGLVLSAEEIEPTGQVLYNVFVLQKNDGGETVITARKGVVSPDQDAGKVRLLLTDGVAMSADQTGRRIDFERLWLAREFDIDKNPFRPRGDNERELTLGELVFGAGGTQGKPVNARYSSELHARLVRAFSLIGVALLSVPFGVVGKRSPAWPRIIIAVALLTGYNHMIQIVEDIADLGWIDPALSLWSLWALFMLIAVGVYTTTASTGTRGIVRAALRPFDQFQHRMIRYLKIQFGAAREPARR